LEGWPQTPSLLPPFETAARQSERPPQGDGGVDCSRSISRTFCGVTGSSITAPGTPNAASIAAATAAPTAGAPPSPAPFRPRGLSGLGASSLISTSTGGASRAVGSR